MDKWKELSFQWATSQGETSVSGEDALFQDRASSCIRRWLHGASGVDGSFTLGLAFRVSSSAHAEAAERNTSPPQAASGPPPPRRTPQPPVVDPEDEEETEEGTDPLAALSLTGSTVSNVFGPDGLGSGTTNALGGLKGAATEDTTARSERRQTTPTVVPEKFTWEGALAKEEIERVIKRVMVPITHCYEDELRKNPNLEGKLVMAWVIGASGAVQAVETVQNTFADPTAAPIDACVRRALQRSRFPRPDGGTVKVTSPFAFSVARD